MIEKQRKYYRIYCIICFPFIASLAVLFYILEKTNRNREDTSNHTETLPTDNAIPETSKNQLTTHPNQEIDTTSPGMNMIHMDWETRLNEEQLRK